MVSSIWAVGSSARLSKLISKIFNEVSGSCKCFELPKIEPMMEKKKWNCCISPYKIYIML